jgi:Tfp pilus assembly protein PilN
MEVSPSDLLAVIGEQTIRIRLLEARLAEAEQRLAEVDEAAVCRPDAVPA